MDPIVPKSEEKPDGKPIPVRLTPSLRKRVLAIADETGLSVSAALRYLLAFAVEAYEAQKKTERSAKK